MHSAFLMRTFLEKEKLSPCYFVHKVISNHGTFKIYKDSKIFMQQKYDEKQLINIAFE